ncbi:MAG: hypothetical protein E6J00_12820 [Chloroflexi bacterium]|nr:MAG: hypothetical protein E6J00_12820 [Chloroflexota bacterium]
MREMLAGGRRRIVLLAAALALSLGWVTGSPMVALATTVTGLEDTASQWGIFWDNGTGTGSITNVSSPSRDSDQSMKISLTSGSSYVGLHAYRNLAADDAATTFQIDDYYYFTTTTPIQALEFTMNKWVNNTRYEWAMQWENKGTGVPPPVWRIWTGSSWQSTGHTQSLAVNTWHHIQIKGTVSGGQVHYVSFTSDSLSASLGQSYPPVSSTGDKLAIAFQLDSDSNGDAYTLYADTITFSHS